MPFIAKNPLIIPEVESSPSVPKHGTRGIFSGKDGLYEIDSNGNVTKIANINDFGGGLGAATSVYAYVHILGGEENWTPEDVVNGNGDVVGSRFGQVVYDYNNEIFNIDNAVITPNSKVDLHVTSEQMVIFYEKSLAFVAENDDGVVTVYCVGTIPKNNYRVQAVITEVIVNG